MTSGKLKRRVMRLLGTTFSGLPIFLSKGRSNGHTIISLDFHDVGLKFDFGKTRAQNAVAKRTQPVACSNAFLLNVPSVFRFILFCLFACCWCFFLPRMVIFYTQILATCPFIVSGISPSTEPTAIRLFLILAVSLPLLFLVRFSAATNIVSL